MGSSFMGLETSKRGLFTQQSALYTTGHNISNANTLGYSRQRVNMEATAGFPGVGLNSGTMPGFLGTGVQAGSIQRIRDSFVDHQYRQESTKLGYWDTTSKAITQMEDVLNEPSAYGLQKSLSEFWSSLQVLSTNPENSGARDVAVQRGVAVADSFNYISKSISEIQTNLGTEIGITTKSVNSILQQIAELNEQITKVEPNGYLPNDLYDARDMLLDQLSAIVPIETDYIKSGGRALAIAEGAVIVKVKLKDETIEVVNGNSFSKMSVSPADGEGKSTGPVEKFSFGGKEFDIDKMVGSGTMRSLVDSYGYKVGTAATDVKGLYPDMIKQLDKMAQEFAKEFNRIHKGGTDLNGENGVVFFVNKNTILDPDNADPDHIADDITAGNIYVNQELISNSGKLAASDSDVSTGNGQEGNGKNAMKLSNMQFNKIGGLGDATVQSYFQGVIGKLGVDGEQATRLAYNTATLLGAVEHRRASISSVSLDEEMTDMIRFQQAYNASARMITVVDETLDKIINGMGVVGR